MGAPWVEQRIRPRRNRQSPAMRNLVRENSLTARCAKVVVCKYITCFLLHS
jgi:delta-aminolevulinic acid dehydratase/porphobilinogen synthase